MESWATLEEFKSKLAIEMTVEIKLPDGFSTMVDIPEITDFDIKFCRQKRVLGDDENHKSLKQLGWMPNEKLYVQKKKK